MTKLKDHTGIHRKMNVSQIKRLLVESFTELLSKLKCRHFHVFLYHRTCSEALRSEGGGADQCY